MVQHLKDYVSLSLPHICTSLDTYMWSGKLLKLYMYIHCTFTLLNANILAIIRTQHCLHCGMCVRLTIIILSKPYIRLMDSEKIAECMWKQCFLHNAFTIIRKPYTHT